MEDSGSTEHPIQAAGIDLCLLARSVASSRKLTNSEAHNFTIKELKKALRAIGVNDYSGKSRAKIAQHIKNYVQENCDCMVAFID